MLDSIACRLWCNRIALSYLDRSALPSPIIDTSQSGHLYFHLIFISGFSFFPLLFRPASCTHLSWHMRCLELYMSFLNIALKTLLAGNCLRIYRCAYKFFSHRMLRCIVRYPYIISTRGIHSYHSISCSPILSAGPNTAFSSGGNSAMYVLR